MQVNGKVRVGSILIDDRGQKVYPTYDGYEPIEVMTPSSEYGSIGPYALKTDEGYIMENVWQFSKLYRMVPAMTSYLSKYSSQVIWEYPQELHVNSKNEVDSSYFKWRALGYINRYAVRYPVGYSARSSCLCSVWDPIVSFDANICPPNPKVYSYVESRKVIYVPLYRSLVRQQKQFSSLREKLAAGINLMIMEVDGPRDSLLSYYKEKYNVPDTWIVNNSLEMNETNFRLMLNDSKRAFGHGYCLAQALLDEKDAWSLDRL